MKKLLLLSIISLSSLACADRLENQCYEDIDWSPIWGTDFGDLHENDHSALEDIPGARAPDGGVGKHDLA